MLRQCCSFMPSPIEGRSLEFEDSEQLDFAREKNSPGFQAEFGLSDLKYEYCHVINPRVGAYL